MKCLWSDAHLINHTPPSVSGHVSLSANAGFHKDLTRKKCCVAAEFYHSDWHQNGGGGGEPNIFN